MSCGTPVLAFARGGIPELLTRDAGRLLAGPTGKQLSAAEIVSAVTALTEVRNLDRAIVRQQAELLCSDSAMLSGYEHVYQDALLTWELQ
jgi:glycosyltransferase involved in cell wall biosynthesis